MSRKSKKTEPVNPLLTTIDTIFPFRGRLDCKFLWADGGVSRYRLNWYAKTWEKSFATEYISHSEFIEVHDDGRIFIVKGTNSSLAKT